jgi:adenine-specific DNA-methyltransferase
MYPRLKLARNLLRDDGVIFISIDDHEQANLKRLCDEVFGEGNFIELFSWVKTSTPPALSTKSRKTNEHILCYEKSRNSTKYDGEPLDGGDQPLLNRGNNLVTLKFPKEKVLFSFIKSGVVAAGTNDRVELLHQLTIQNGYSLNDFELSGEFKWTQKFLDEEIEKGTTFIIKSEKISIRFIRQEEGYKRPTNYIKEKYTSPLVNKKLSGVGTNENASTELIDLMSIDAFSYPKPVSLIKYLGNFVLHSDDIILDFFSGSATTAHAVMQLNAEDGGKRKFIMVQIPEACDPKSEAYKAGYKTITEIGKERIRRAGQKIKTDNALTATDLDIGFRVLKIDSSNMKDVYYTPDNLNQNDLFNLVDNVREDRSAEDLLFQVLLDWGVDLTLPITQETIADFTVLFVDDNALAACFDADINEAFVKELAARHPMRVVFRDTCFANDSIKINIEQIFKLISPATEIKTL